MYWIDVDKARKASQAYYGGASMIKPQWAKEEVLTFIYRLDDGLDLASNGDQLVQRTALFYSALQLRNWWWSSFDWLTILLLFLVCLPKLFSSDLVLVELFIW